MEKEINSIYTTFKGGLGSWNEDMTRWEYFCLWGHLRFYYDGSHRTLKDDWTHISLHGYRYGYAYSPVEKLLWRFDWHMAYSKRWPFIKIGFKRIWPLFKDVL